MIEFEKIKELVDELEPFTFQFDIEENISFLPAQLSYEQYSELVNRKLSRVRELMLDILKVVDPKTKLQFLQDIHDKIVGFNPIVINLSSYPYIIVPDHKNDGTDDMYDRPEPASHSKLDKAYDVYLQIQPLLLNFFNSALMMGGFQMNSGKVVGPFDATTLTKLQINTKFNVDQFAYFLFLLKESLIFDARHKSEVAEMASNNFITDQQKHYSKDSIANRMIPNPSQADKDVVKNELKKMINKIK